MNNSKRELVVISSILNFDIGMFEGMKELSSEDNDKARYSPLNLYLRLKYGNWGCREFAFLVTNMQSSTAESNH